MNYKEPIYRQQYSDFQRKGRIKRCFYCDRETNVIASHSISEKKCLKLLCEPVCLKKGVYGFRHVELSNTNWDKPFFFANFEVVGIQKASTFKGFCKNHDQVLFKTIDENSFEKDSLEQCFLYCYRAFAKAVHTKNEELKSCSSHSTYREHNYEYIARRQEEIEIGITFDLGNYKTKMNKWLSDCNYTHLEHFYCKTNSFHPIATASFCQPTFTINNYRINDYKDDSKPLNHIFINIIPELECTHVLFSCFKDQPQSLRFITELKDIYEVDKECFGKFITSLLVIHTENTFIAPSLIDGLPTCERFNLLMKLRDAVTIDKQYYLLDNPIDFSESVNLFTNKF